MRYGYCRVSTEEQTKGTSLKDQRATLLAEGIAPGAIYVDEGVSAAKPLHDRPAGKLMLGNLKRGDEIVAVKLDRLFRSLSDAANSMDRFRQEGIGIILLDMGRQSITSNGAAELYFGVMAAVAQFERERIRERIAAGKRAKKDAGGCIGPVPFGKRKVGQGKRAILKDDPAEQRAIATMIELRRQGMPIHDIAKVISADGVAVSESTVRRTLHRHGIRGRVPKT